MLDDVTAGLSGWSGDNREGAGHSGSSESHSESQRREREED